jgi:bifunctional DNase/RNase
MTRSQASVGLWSLLVAVAVCASACKRKTPPPPPPAPIVATASASEAASYAPPPTVPDPVVPASAESPGAAAYADGGAPKGYELAKVLDVMDQDEGAAVLLVDPSGTTVLPIFVGGTEALTIKLRLGGEHYPRPLTHDLLLSLLKELGGHAVKVQVDELRGDIFVGSVFVRTGTRVLQLDARPSDAIAMALGSGVPIYVSKSVMLAAGARREDLDHDPSGDALGKHKRGNPVSL